MIAILRMPELKKDPSRNIVYYHFTMRGMKAPQKPQCFRNLRRIRIMRSGRQRGEHESEAPTRVADSADGRGPGPGYGRQIDASERSGHARLPRLRAWFYLLRSLQQTCSMNWFRCQAQLRFFPRVRFRPPPYLPHARAVDTRRQS